MRHAQLLAGAIYLVFYALAGVVAHPFRQSDVAAITTMLGTLPMCSRS